MNIFGKKNNSNEISLFRRKICSFFILTVIYGFIIGISSFRIIPQRTTKEVLIDITIWVCFFIPYLLTIFDLIKECPKIRRVFEIKEENKIRDIIQIIWMVLLFIPFAFFMLLIIGFSFQGFKFILENCRF